MGCSLVVTLDHANLPATTPFTCQNMDARVGWVGISLLLAMSFRNETITTALIREVPCFRSSFLFPHLYVAGTVDVSVTKWLGVIVCAHNRHVFLHSLSANHAIDVAYVIGIPCALNAECVSLSYVSSHTLHHNTLMACIVL